ncbi:uncharacterized protein [Blastocystis hominis]|uniref:Uncharacterized protein n=1 Tax=Blastocystis hominis TaxID=12968 RepID=D8M3F7_BLAHO|nr:uncharacterized protein [Blastocystis hominis]CBK22430.2 unnamed protein product [Blastocystis hominis]|eukprot:XP_012896478.1 uncharacterized protein [Blastocystis hominis]
MEADDSSSDSSDSHVEYQYETPEDQNIEESEVIVPNEIEQEREVWNEVRESMSKRIVELNEKVRSLEYELQNLTTKLKEEISLKESAEKERSELQMSLESEKRNVECQVEQILRLNEEVISSMEEKRECETRIQELEEEVQKLEDGMDDPKNYYKLEYGKILQEKLSNDELYQLKCQELKELKDVLSSKLECV